MKDKAINLVMEFYDILGGNKDKTLDEKADIMIQAKNCARKAIVFSKQYSTFSDTITLRKIGEEIDKLDF